MHGCPLKKFAIAVDRLLGYGNFSKNVNYGSNIIVRNHDFFVGSLSFCPTLCRCRLSCGFTGLYLFSVPLVAKNCYMFGIRWRYTEERGVMF